MSLLPGVIFSRYFLPTPAPASVSADLLSPSKLLALEALALQKPRLVISHSPSFDEVDAQNMIHTC